MEKALPIDFVSDYASDEISTEYRDAVPNGTQLHQPTRRENLAERSYCLANFIIVSMFLQENGIHAWRIQCGYI